MKKVKKIFSGILAATMLASTFTALSVQAADSVTIKGRFDTRVPLYAEYTTGDDSAVQWYFADSEDGDWTAIDGATSAEYTPQSDMALKWIKVGVTNDGETIYSEPKQMNDRIHGYQTNGNPSSAGELDGVICYPMKSEAKEKAVYETPSQYIFTVDGQEFILLDTTEDDNSHFLVVSRHSIGDRRATYGDGMFPTDLICWLNDKENITRDVDGAILWGQNYNFNNYAAIGGYRAICNGTSEETGFTKLPGLIMDNIDENAVWKFQARRWEGGDVETTIRTGIVVMAFYEYERYSGKFGWNDFKVDGGSDIVWMRTASAWTGVGNQLSTYDRNNGIPVLYDREGGNSYAVRPEFYLNRDFFLKQPFSLETVGSDVRKAIMSTYSREELENAGYSTEELDKYYDQGGKITNVELRGEFETQMPVRIDVQYSGNNELLTYEWYSSDSADGEFTLYNSFSGNNTLEIPVGLGGKYVKVKVLNIYGEYAYTDTVYVEPSWERDYMISHNSIPENGYQEVTAARDGKVFQIRRLDTVNETTPDDYVFTVGDDESAMDFILLDTLDYDESRFLVLSKNVVDSGMPYPKTDAVEGNAEMMAFLNSKNGIEATYEGRYWYAQSTTDYTKSGYIPNTSTRYRGSKTMTQLPESILNSIDANHIWKVENRMWLEGYERTYKCGITIPSMHDIRKYCAKIGLWDDGRISWWTRTPNGVAGDGSQFMYACSGSADLGDFAAAWGKDSGGYASPDDAASYCIRPMFCLDKDYFINYKIDFASAGEDVKRTLTSNYTYDQMIAAGYTEDEIGSYYGDTPSDSVVFSDTATGKKADFTITNCGSDSMTLILALYNADDTLAGVEFKEVTTTSGQTLNDSVEINDVTGAVRAKAMVWTGGINKMKPALDAFDHKY